MTEPTTPTGPAVKVIGTDTVAVDDSGATDVTTVLRSIINSLNDGDILVFAQGDPEGFEHGTTPISEYRISGPLTLTTIPNNVTLWGYGTRIRQYAFNGPSPTFQLLKHDVSGLSFKGFELYGANSAYSEKSNAYSGLPGEQDSGIPEPVTETEQEGRRNDQH